MVVGVGDGEGDKEEVGMEVGEMGGASGTNAGGI
jgi:hypothetical protein